MFQLSAENTFECVSPHSGEQCPQGHLRWPSPPCVPISFKGAYTWSRFLDAAHLAPQVLSLSSTGAVHRMTYRAVVGGGSRDSKLSLSGKHSVEQRSAKGPTSCPAMEEMKEVSRRGCPRMGSACAKRGQMSLASHAVSSRWTGCGGHSSGAIRGALSRERLAWLPCGCGQRGRGPGV